MFSFNNWGCLRILLQFLYIIKELMSDLAEFMKILKNWQTQTHTKTVTDVLLRIQKCKNTEDQSELNQLLQILVTFHKQINKAAKDKVQQKWFTEVMKSKNNLKKIIQQLKKKLIKVPKLIKSSSQIQYPEQQIKEKDELYKTVMRALYKHYLFNMDEQIMKQKAKICEFFDKVINFMFQEFQFKGQKNKNQNATIRLMERVDKISKELNKSDCSMAKKQMLQGMIKPELVAKCDPLGFFSQEAQRIKQQRLDAIAKQSQTGFYDQLKKKINIDANQECRYCHKPTAYCEGQKQIRASDEPMTRFMICNTCGKRWRQE